MTMRSVHMLVGISSDTQGVCVYAVMLAVGNRAGCNRAVGNRARLQS